MAGSSLWLISSIELTHCRPIFRPDTRNAKLPSPLIGKSCGGKRRPATTIAQAMLSLGSALRWNRSWLGRTRTRAVPNWIEEHLNVTRTLASLAKRGLVRRHSQYGAMLTDKGRS